MSSTVNGYEGTGRSLSLKLVKQLRQQSVGKGTADSKTAPASGSGRTLREITLEEPIRYAEGDKVESWLNNLLCLDCTNKVSSPPSHPLPPVPGLYQQGILPSLPTSSCSTHFTILPLLI
jgi:N-acetyltransferase 10